MDAIKIYVEEVEHTYYEPITGQYFEDTTPGLFMKIDAFNELRLKRKNENVCFNMWLNVLGLYELEVGNFLRWKAYKDVGELDFIRICPEIHIGNKPVWVIEYYEPPCHIGKYSATIN